MCTAKWISFICTHARTHTHAHTQVYSFLNSFTIQAITECWVEFPIVLYIYVNPNLSIYPPPLFPSNNIFSLSMVLFLFCGLPWWLSSKKICLQYRRCRFNSWVRKVPWRRAWKPTPVLLPGKSHRQRSLVGYSLWGFQESDTTQRTEHTCTHFCLVNKFFCTIFFFHSTHKQYHMVLVLCLTYFIQYNSL